MTVYTDALVAGLKALSVEGAPVTYAQAVAFAEANGLKPRSVIAKIKSLKLPYEPKPVRVTKAGEPVELKASIVKAIEVALGGVALKTLDKASKEDLKVLLGKIGEVASH
jgi:hypothetical protein